MYKISNYLAESPFSCLAGAYGCPSYWEGGRALSIGQIGDFPRLAPYGPELSFPERPPPLPRLHLRVVGGGCQLSFFKGKLIQEKTKEQKRSSCLKER